MRAPRNPHLEDEDDDDYENTANSVSPLCLSRSQRFAYGTKLQVD